MVEVTSFCVSLRSLRRFESLERSMDEVEPPYFCWARCLSRQAGDQML